MCLPTQRIEPEQLVRIWDCSGRDYKTYLAAVVALPRYQLSCSQNPGPGVGLVLGDIAHGEVGIHLCDHENALIAHENLEGWSCLSSSRMSGLIIDTSKVYRYSVLRTGAASA